MARRHANLTGQRFGRLVVIQEAPADRNHHPRWLCQCDCGKTKIIYDCNLKSGDTKSCGCLAKETFTTHGDTQIGKKTKLYIVWTQILQRCNNKNNKRFNRYGGRGIKVCKDWHDYTAFKKWAHATGYKDGLSIDRIDNDGDYTPSNCRWADNYTQHRNRKNNVRIVVDGVEMVLVDAARLLGVKRQTFSQWCKKYGSTDAIARAKRFLEAHNANAK